MDNNTKLASILLTLLMAVTATAVASSAYAQPITKPSTPQFTVELAGPAFDVPPTYSFNASTGLFDANDGYHFQYSVVNVVIQNQPYQPFTNQTKYDYLYYNVRVKPHNYMDSYWSELFHAGADGYPIQTPGNTTVIPIAIEDSQASGPVIGAGASTDIQVEAMIGHIERGSNPNATNQIEMYPYVFSGEVSGWSSTQTVNVPPKTPFTVSPSATPSSTPVATSSTAPYGEVTLPLAAFTGIIALLILVICALSLLLLRRNGKQKMP